MTLCNFLSEKVDKSNPHEIIPFSFYLQEVLQEEYYIHTRSRAQAAGITIGKVHWHDKLLPSLTETRKRS